MESPTRRTRLLTAIVALTTIGTAQTPLEQVATEFELLGCSVTSFCGDSIQQSFHWGTRQLEAGWPVTSSTQYRIASVSKAVVATACARLVESGELAYEAPVDAWLGWSLVHPGHPSVPVTVGDLLSHRSGLQDGQGYSAFLGATYAAGPGAPPIADLVLEGGSAFTSDMWHAAEPGSYFQYANVNYGVLATVLEAATGLRFDALMDSLVLHPLGIAGSFNVGTLPDWDDVATLYRNQGGWVPQADDFINEPPVGWDFSAYVPGTNGLLFAPQGGLRISTEELARIAAVWEDGAWNGVALLEAPGIAALQEAVWTADGSNGNTYFGLFNSWSWGLHRANLHAGDAFFGDQTLFIGHPGEAYGLISDLYLEPETGWGFAFATNGAWSGYSFGETSWYAVEEAIHLALADDRNACATSTGVGASAATAPTDDARTRWFDLSGRHVTTGHAPEEPGIYVSDRGARNLRIGN